MTIFLNDFTLLRIYWEEDGIIAGMILSPTLAFWMKILNLFLTFKFVSEVIYLKQLNNQRQQNS